MFLISSFFAIGKENFDNIFIFGIFIFILFYRKKEDEKKLGGMSGSENLAFFFSFFFLLFVGKQNCLNEYQKC